MNTTDFDGLIRDLRIRNYDKYEKENEKAIIKIDSPTSKMTTLRIFDKNFVFDYICAKICEVFCIKNSLYFFVDSIHNRLEINFLKKVI